MLISAGPVEPFSAGHKCQLLRQIDGDELASDGALVATLANKLNCCLALAGQRRVGPPRRKQPAHIIIVIRRRPRKPILAADGRQDAAIEFWASVAPIRNADAIEKVSVIVGVVL